MIQRQAMKNGKNFKGGGAYACGYLVAIKFFERRNLNVRQ